MSRLTCWLKPWIWHRPSNIASFNTLSIRTKSQSGRANVAGGIRTKQLGSNSVIEASTLVVNTSNLVVLANHNIGINAVNPIMPVQIVADDQYSNSDDAFYSKDFKTWNSVIIQNPDAASGVGVGVLLIPDTSLDPNIGSGIVAVGTVDLLNGIERSHDLVIMTDPEKGPPAERVRIKGNGRVGMGTDSPGSLLDVNGRLYVTGKVTANLLVVPTISGTSLVFEGVTSTKPTMDMRGSIQLSGASMMPVNTFTVSSGDFSIFSNASDGGIYLSTYQDGAALIADFGSRLPTPTGSIPIFNEQHLLDGTSFVKWDAINGVGTATQNSLSMGRADAFAFSPGNPMFQFISGVSATSPQESVSVERVAFEFGDRTAASSTQFFGVNVEAPTNETLGVEDVMVGVSVVVSSDLKSSSVSPIGRSVTGQKIAAIFNAGASSSNVVIAVTDNMATLPSYGDFYLLNAAPKQAALRVTIPDGIGGVLQEMTVSSNGNVGLNVAEPVAPLTVLSRSGDTRAQVLSSTLTSLFEISSSNFVGIGTSSPKSLLDVNGTANASVASFNNSVSSHTLSVTSSNLFVVLGSGYVGMGTSVPEAQHHLKKSFAYPLDLTSSYRLMSNLFETALDGSGNGAVLDAYGLQMVVTSNTGGHFGRDGSPVTITGINVDLTGLELYGASELYGVNVKVATGSGMAAALFGGRVGVGTAVPQAALDIAGTLSGGSVVQDTLSNWSLVSITANVLSVSGNSILETVDVSTGTVNADTIALTSDVNFLPGSRRYPLGIFSTLTSDVATFNRLVIPTYNSDMVLGVGVTSNVLVVSGSMRVDRLSSLKEVTVNVVGVNDRLDVLGALSTSRRVVGDSSWASKQILFTAIPTPSTRPTNDTLLFVNSTDSSLVYVNPELSVTADISGVLVGSSNRLGYFNSSRRIVTDGYMDLVTVNEIGILRVGTDSSSLRNTGASVFKTTSRVPTVSSTPASIYSVGLSVGIRAQGAATSINAARVQLGNVGDQLGANDVAAGLNVEFDSSVTTNVYTRSGVLVTANFDSAIFISGKQTSGNVVIVTSPNIPVLGLADLYLATAITTNGIADFVVQSTVNGAMRDLIIVSNNGLVGMGGGSGMSGQLSIGGVEPGVDALAIYRSNGETLVVGDSQGVVIGGGSAPDRGLWVNGAATVVTANTGGFLPKTLKVSPSNGGLVVSSEGNVGIGTSAPGAQLELTRSFARPESLTSALTLQTVSLNISAVAVPNDLTGVSFVASSAVSTTVGDLGGVNAVSVTGMSIDGSALALAANGVLSGLYMAPTSNGNVASAVLMGGNVGVGISNPQVALEIGGTLKGGNIYADGPKDWSLIVVTANGMVVSGDSIMDVMEGLTATVNADTITITSSLVDNIPGDRRYPILVATDMTASVATMNRLVLPTMNADMNLYSGTTANVMIVSGSVIANDWSVVVGGVTLNSIGVSGQLGIPGGVSTNRRIFGYEPWLVKELLLTSGTVPTQRPTSDSFLFVNSSDVANLYYVSTIAGVTANISDTLVGSGNRLGYFNSSKRFVGDGQMDVTTVNSVGILKVGTSSTVVRSSGNSILKTMAQIPTVSSTSGTLYAVDLSVGARSQGSATTINSASIRLGNSGDFLGPGDTASGLNIEFASSVTSSVVNRSGTTISGAFRAATFIAGGQTSGNVLIVTSPNIPVIGLADLYIATVVTPNGRGDFLIQGTVNNSLKDLLVVSNNGSVGFGSSANVGIGRLAINSNDSGIDSLGIYSSSGLVLAAGENGGVGIGTTGAISKGMVVNGQVSATKAQGLGVLGKTLSLGASRGGLVVNSAGDVGIGTTAPGAQMELARSFLRPESMTSDFVMQTVSVSVEEAAVTTTITAVEFVATASGLTVLGDLGGTSVSAVGMSLDLSGVNLASNTILKGIYV
ncbi:hypothetical protein EBR57_01525, partial [bacterium]|nr:hypothetical protein [bacterium]